MSSANVFKGEYDLTNIGSIFNTTSFNGDFRIAYGKDIDNSPSILMSSLASSKALSEQTFTSFVSVSDH